MAKKNVKTHLLDHSEAKVRLLKEYLKRYLSIISNLSFIDAIDVHDLFCGEGVYKNGGEGSPLIIMRAVNNLYGLNVAKRSKLPKVNCNFNDIDPSKTQNVENAIISRSLHSSSFGTLSFSSIDYKLYLTDLTRKLRILPKNHKAFVFIDPYEYRHIKISHIKKLMANEQTEVLLWLPTQFMYRFEKNGTPTALKDFIEEIVPFEEWKQSSNVWDFINEMKEGFKSALGYGYYVDNFTIQKDNNTVFCLFFFTSHIKGFEKMLESKWDIDTEQGKGWNYTGNAPTLFHSQTTNPLEEKLRTFLDAQPRTNTALYKFTLECGFLPKHTNQILKDWQDNGLLDVILYNGKTARKKSFYINSKSLTTDVNKVTITKRVKLL